MEKKKAKTTKYSAPALEKGIDILELLSKDTVPLSTSHIAEKLGRSNAEIYRMLLVLEQRGFISRDEDSDGYRVTRKLLQLGTEQQPIKEILEYSMPILRTLAEKTTMSCHIAVKSNEQIVVIARVEAPSNISYSIRVGYRKPIIQTASGKVMYAFQSPEMKESWLTLINQEHGQEAATKFVAECKKVSKEGHVNSPSRFVTGVTDLSVPIIDSDHAIAALTIPYIQRIPEIISIPDVLEELQKAADGISKALTFGVIKGF